ncbi:MAG: toxic anion resistance protein, partial [Deltaproteobacteria bacterium]|nr:toxic anion resistance protein [Deltaproteobacteria bacterium]
MADDSTTSAGAPVTPPPPNDVDLTKTFSLTKLDPEKLKEEVTQELQLAPQEVDPLKEQAKKNAEVILSLDPAENDQTKKVLEMMKQFADSSMDAVSAGSSKFLETSASELSKAGEGGGVVSKSLVDLDTEIRNLDPEKVNFSGKGFLGIFFNPVRRYFGKYKKSESVLSSILDSLDKGKATLISDNADLEKEQLRLRTNTKKLLEDFEMGQNMDTAIDQKISEAEAQGKDPDKIKFIKEEILFPLRQKLIDIQQLQTVSQQGIIAMEVIQRNNRELIRGVERAKNVTVNALRISITVAGALYNQKVTLEKIQALNATTENLIAQTSKMLKEQGTEIHKQAASSSISVDVLKQAFSDVLQSLDEINRYKVDSLPIMKQTIGQFRELATKGETEIQKLEKGSALAKELLPKSETPPA